MTLPTNIEILEIISDYTGLYREIKFTGTLVNKKWFGLKKETSNHTYCAFGNVGNWILIKVDGHSVKIPVHTNSFLRPFLDSEILFFEYKKSGKWDAGAVDKNDKLRVNCI